MVERRRALPPLLRTALFACQLLHVRAVVDIPSLDTLPFRNTSAGCVVHNMHACMPVTSTFPVLITFSEASSKCL